MNEKKFVGIWIRVSTDMQVKDESPEHHERRARAYVESKGWEVVEIYRLEAVSGKAVIGHPEAKRMLADVKAQRISGLIFSKLARLARNTKELLEFAEIFRAYNADLISLSESIDTSSPAGRLFYTMIAALTEWERAEIAERVAASVPVRAKMGKPLGGQASFGYAWSDKELVIDEKEAPVRKLLYELFLTHQRKKHVAKLLNQLGHRTRNGSLFASTTIHRLLRDPTAKGVRIANYTKSRGEGKGWDIKPTSEWVLIPCPAIVTAENWDSCNQILDAQEKKRKPQGKKAAHLLSGFVSCHCGHKMYVYHSSNVYTCKHCKNRISAADLDEIYYGELAGILKSYSIDGHTSNREQELKEKEQLLKTAQQQAAKLSKRMHDLVGLHLDGGLTKERFKEEHRPMETQLQQLERTIPELEAEIDFWKIERLSTDTILEEASNLYHQWPSFTFERKREIVELITEAIIIENQEITIRFCYLPTNFQNGEKGTAGLPLWLL